jgi:hypothetical protein
MPDLIALKITADWAERHLADQIGRISRSVADPMSKAIESLIEAKIAVALAALQGSTPGTVATTPSPVAIWHAGDARGYYEATPEARQAWNAYATKEELRFWDTGEGLFRDRDGKATPWCPCLYFPEWQSGRLEKP